MLPARRMKILHVIDSLRAGGKERRLVELLRGLSRRGGFGLSLVILDDRIHYDEIFELDLVLKVLKRARKKDPGVLRKLFGVCRVHRPEVIHVWDGMSAVYAVPLSVYFHIKLVNGMITNADPHVRPFTKAWVRSRLTFPFSDAIVANSQAGLRAYRAPSRRSAAIVNGFDAQRSRNIRPAEAVRKELGITTGHVVGMVGSFHQRKDYETFFEAARRILARRHDISFVAVGDGELCAPLKAKYEEAGGGKIIFAGKRADTQSIINIFDVGVLLTNVSTHGEGISNAIMEYMGQGKPVVATDCGGTPEIILNGKTGYLVGPAAVDMVYERITRLIDNPRLASEMGEAGQKRIQIDFSIEGMVDKYAGLYASLVGVSIEPKENIV